MNAEDERTLWLAAGIFFVCKYTWQWTPALQEQGVRLYEALHNDEGHVKDLPGQTLTRAAILAIAQGAGFPDPKLATAIALAESGGVVNALMRSTKEISVGLWQINTKVHPYTPEEMAVPVLNAEAAYKISKGGTDWTPWTTFTSGKYRKFLTGILA